MTKMVQLSDEAYRRLKKEKQPGESFSDVILRRFPQGSLSEIFGLASEGEAEEMRRLVDEIDAYSLEKQDREMRERGLL